MKSERRHELQHNELAEWLITSIEAVRPYQNLILVVVVIGVVAIGSYMWWTSNTAIQTARAWDELSAGLSNATTGAGLDDLMKVAEDYRDTSAGRMATVLAGDMYLAGGCDQLFVSKAPAQQDLSKAIELYESEFKPEQTSAIRERATFGFARARESKGDLSSATEYYREVVKRWPNGAYTGVAQQRLDDLARPETKRMYDDFAHFDPRPAFQKEKEPALPGEPPSFESPVPGEHPTGSPKKTSDGLKAGGSSAAKDASKGVGGQTKPTKPVEAAKPANTAKPAAKEKPSGEKIGK